MQTFVPYLDNAASAQCLDLARLGKQIIECRQIGRAITDPSYGWQSHPAVNMWRGSLGGLLKYTKAMHDEWSGRRGKQHKGYLNMLDDHATFIRQNVQRNVWTMPAWYGRLEVHQSHQSNLLRKDSAHYGQFGWTVPHDLEYVWPGKD